MSANLAQAMPLKVNGHPRTGKFPHPSALTFYEFFAGVGMARLGLSEPWECVWANDIDFNKAKLYSNCFGGDHFDPRDIALVADDVKRGDLGSTESKPAFPVGVDMAWASFPCQDLSLAGWGHGISGRRSGTYWHFHEVMATLAVQGARPPIITLENVTGLLYGDSFRGLCESFAVLGMRFGALVIDAKHFVPQSRPRVFFVAVDDTLAADSLEDSKPNDWHTRALVAAHAHLPDDLKARWIWWNLPRASKPRLDVASIYEASPSDVEYHSASETKRLLSLMSASHLAKVRQAIDTGGFHLGFLYKRTRKGVQRAEVRFDGIAGCLRTPKGGSSRQIVVVVDKGKVRSRLLSRNEAARLMGIPVGRNGCLRGSRRPFFPAGIGYNEAYHAMGDGVAVPAVKHLARHLLTPLALLSREADANTAREVAASKSSHKIQESVNTRIAAFSTQER